MHPLIDSDNCIGCGACVSACPVSPKVFELRELEGIVKSAVAHPESCDALGGCVRACPTEAIRLVED
ncbi:MAG: ferredoxin family protein [Candidatus Altiarchaeota archaeon]